MNHIFNQIHWKYDQVQAWKLLYTWVCCRKTRPSNRHQNEVWLGHLNSWESGREIVWPLSSWKCEFMSLATGPWENIDRFWLWQYRYPRLKWLNAMLLIVGKLYFDWFENTFFYRRSFKTKNHSKSFEVSFKLIIAVKMIQHTLSETLRMTPIFGP